MDWDPDESDVMLANTTVDIKNGVLSFENPNYTLGHALDDALNRNENLDSSAVKTLPDASPSSCGDTDTANDVLDGGLAALDTLYTELDHVCNLTRSSSVRTRRHYAQLDIESMGVDVTTGPVTNLDHADHENNRLSGTGGMMGRRKGTTNAPSTDVIGNSSLQRNNCSSHQQQTANQLLSNTQESKVNKNEVVSEKNMMTPDGGYCMGVGDSQLTPDGGDSPTASKMPFKHSSPSHEGQIPHMTPDNSEDLYALPVKRSFAHDEDLQLSSEEKKDGQADDVLPPGWERHEDNDGPYYWHIKSGTITRTPPPPLSSQAYPDAPLRSDRRNKDSETTSGSLASSVTRSNTSSALSELSEARPRSSALDNAYKRRSYPARSDMTDTAGSRPIRFAVRSLGWVEIAEEDLTPERSSKAVNRCIVDLSMGTRRDLLDVVGRWGDGKDLFMDLDEGSLKLVDPENLTVLNTQPIHTIRVWGVGRDNGRDFAYVARDRVTRKHMCHVFRCDTPARTIANTLRDICKKIMIERSLQQTMMTRPVDGAVMGGPGMAGGGGAGPGMAAGGRLARPTNLPTEQRRLHKHSQIIPSQSFPTPMEEPKKMIRAQYLGVIQVTKPTGMEVLHAAIQVVSNNNPPPWKQVLVAVAPSTITITAVESGKQLAECRVRYLSFLGIGKDVKQCAFIMHTAQDQFLAHVFNCEPSSGALCKTIEAACKLRYQKCLDAHPGGRGRGRGSATPKSISSTLRTMFTSITGRKARSAES